MAAKPLRPGERRADLGWPRRTRRRRPTGVGTDDYRCFLLDPDLTRTRSSPAPTSLPGNPDVVHHVILFRVAPGQVASARADGRDAEGEGWTCFGGIGLRGSETSTTPPGSAPGHRAAASTVHRKGYGVPLRSRHRIVMQVHYNLLAGAEPGPLRAAGSGSPRVRPT